MNGRWFPIYCSCNFVEQQSASRRGMCSTCATIYCVEWTEAATQAGSIAPSTPRTYHADPRYFAPGGDHAAWRRPGGGACVCKCPRSYARCGVRACRCGRAFAYVPVFFLYKDKAGAGGSTARTTRKHTNNAKQTRTTQSRRARRATATSYPPELRAMSQQAPAHGTPPQPVCIVLWVVCRRW